jgi:hypothetical protein
VPAVRDEVRLPVDGKVVVARTRDSGATCEVLHPGLPQEQADDLTFRHGLDVTSAARRSLSAARPDRCGFRRMPAIHGSMCPRICRRFIACALRAVAKGFASEFGFEI